MLGQKETTSMIKSQKSEYEITTEDVEPIMNEKISDQTIFSTDKNAFGYLIPEEEKKEPAN